MSSDRVVSKLAKEKTTTKIVINSGVIDGVDSAWRSADRSKIFRAADSLSVRSDSGSLKHASSRANAESSAAAKPGQGPAVFGDIGDAHRLEFAVIGDTVNVASRLERLTRPLDANIVAGGDLVAQVRREAGGETLLEGFRERPGQEIPGRSGVITVWAR